jgi:hypothetical protein
MKKIILITISIFLVTFLGVYIYNHFNVWFGIGLLVIGLCVSLIRIESILITNFKNKEK